MEKENKVTDLPAIIGSDLFSQLKRHSFSENTRIAYEKGWRHWTQYCSQHGYDPWHVSPSVVAAFLFEAATVPRPPTDRRKSGKPLSLGTVQLFRSAIKSRYTDSGLPSPTSHPDVEMVMRALPRMVDSKARQVKALYDKHLVAILDLIDEKPTSTRLRDAAVLAIGFAAALRRSELCALKMNDVEWVISGLDDEELVGIRLTVQRSKTDQSGEGQIIAVPTGRRIRPVQRLIDYLNDSGHTSGFVFRAVKRGGKSKETGLHHSDVPRIVKTWVQMVGLNPADFSAHSLRAGFVTSAAMHQARLDKIMEVTRHQRPETVMKYIRDEELFVDHAGGEFL